MYGLGHTHDRRSGARSPTSQHAVSVGPGLMRACGAGAIPEPVVALHDVRIAAEPGRVTWVRPDFQAARFGSTEAPPGLELDAQDVSAKKAPKRRATPWPTEAVGQISALRKPAAPRPVTVEEATAQFSGASRAIVERHLDTLAILGELRTLAGGRCAASLAAA